MPDPISAALSPLPPQNTGGNDAQARMAALSPQYQSLVKILSDYGMDMNNPSSVTQLIEVFRKEGNHQMANAAENLSNYLNNGRGIPLSVFNLPGYQQTKGYR